MLPLCAQSTLTPIPEPTTYAIETLSNIIKNIEITGIHRVHHDGWLEEEAESLPLKDAKSEFHDELSMTPASLVEYVSATRYLFPVLKRLMETSDRELVLKSFDLFNKLCSVKENQSVLAYIPTEFLEDILCLVNVANVSSEHIKNIPSASSNNILSMNSNSNTITSVAGSMNPSIISVGGFIYTMDDIRPPMCVGPFSEFNDTELRDLALDTIHILITSSDQMLIRVAGLPRIKHILKRILKLSAGDKYRGGPSQKAGTILATLASKANIIPSKGFPVMPVELQSFDAFLEDY